MLYLEDYKIEYSNGTKIEYGNIHVKKGEFVGLFGRSGCGKTSLLESLFSPTFPGKVTYKTALLEGKPLPEPGPEFYKHVSYCPQYAQAALNPRIVVDKMLDFTLKGNGMERNEEEIDALLAKLKLERELLQRYPSQLSGGQIQRMVMFLCNIKKPDILIMDEPSSAIDLITLKEISEFIVSLKGDVTMLMVAHSRPLLQKISDRIIDF